MIVSHILLPSFVWFEFTLALCFPVKSRSLPFHSTNTQTLFRSLFFCGCLHSNWVWNNCPWLFKLNRKRELYRLYFIICIFLLFLILLFSVTIWIIRVMSRRNSLKLRSAVSRFMEQVHAKDNSDTASVSKLFPRPILRFNLVFGLYHNFTYMSLGCEVHWP